MSRSAGVDVDSRLTPVIHPEVAGSLLPDAERAKTIARASVGQHGRRARISLSLTTLFCALEKVSTDSYRTWQEIRSVTGTELCEKYESVTKEPD
jgi:hypothetical protein